MSVEDFFALFLLELREAESLHHYYKFHTNARRTMFRKAYFCQRLNYVLRHVGTNREQRIWDCGCGYGTTAIFLALNGHRVEGTTLEFYFPVLQKRLAYWASHGDVSGFSFRYEDLFAAEYTGVFDTILLQDTLHHVEPIGQGLQILRKALRPGGKLVVVEENGANSLQKLKLLRQRGFQKTVSYYDETLQRTVTMGNEAIRSLQEWRRLFAKAGLKIEDQSIEWVRLLPPQLAQGGSMQELIQWEQQLAHRFPFLKNHFFFGINFLAHKA